MKRARLVNILIFNHGEELRDSHWKPLDSGKTFFDISVNTDKICIEFEADIPEKWQTHAHCMQLSDKDLVKKLLTSNRKIRSLANNFLTRSLSESH